LDILWQVITQLKISMNQVILLLYLEKTAHILENKIYAEDQPEQLARYFKIVQKQGIEDISVIYLTLYGDTPTEQSMEE